MLKIWFGNKKNAIYNTSQYFEHQKDPKWVLDQIAKKIIKDIDKSLVVNENTINSPVLGQIPIDKLSNGVKTLLLIKNMPNKIFNASNCGNNCAEWLLKIADEKDITINLHHTMDFGNKKFKVKVMNKNPKIVDNMTDLVFLSNKYLNEEN